MAKRFKFKFPSINVPSFQFCRLKSPSSFPNNPKPVTYRRSPVNPKAFDITYPSLSPAPPPSTPEFSYVSSSKPTGMIRSSNGWDPSSEFLSRTVQTTSSKKNKKKPRKSSHVVDEDEDSLVLLDSSRSFSSERYPRGRRDQPKKTETASSETKVRESVAVVKKSENPYEDFKRSMLEMIMQKQMFRGADLEELLQCFLTLNSRQYHGIIVEAFSEIWETLFCDSNIKHRLSF